MGSGGFRKMLYRFPEIVFRASKEFEPHYVANYLIELVRMYNSFYGNTQIINKDDDSSSYKVASLLLFCCDEKWFVFTWYRSTGENVNNFKFYFM